CVVDEVGVALAELGGEWVPEPPWEGDDVPELASFDFLEDLFESLALESCSCQTCQLIQSLLKPAGRLRLRYEDRKHEGVYGAYHSLPEPLHTWEPVNLFRPAMRCPGGLSW